jgi:acetyltransferase
MEDRTTRVKERLQSIFYPGSVAVVGTNRVRGTVPYDILNNIIKADFQGIVYPVSPRDKSILSTKTFKYVVDIEDPVDLAVIVFPSSVCHLALEQCGEKGIKSAIIISAGFKEVGEHGKKKEEQLKEIAARHGISFIGPNCLGVINTDPNTLLNASFARRMPEEGAIGFLSQSGALCTAVLDYAWSKHIGFSKFISFGNKADIDEIDLLYYLKDDPKTKVILVYLEEISDGPALMKAARNVIEESGKPILILKSGRTEAGASAAASHTGSLAGSDEICDAALQQAGIIRCADIEEMFNNALALTYQKMPSSNRVAIITNAGGPGVLTTDSAIHENLQLARFSDETTQMFKKSLPKTANINNPVDVIGDARADRYHLAVSAAMKDPNVDGVFVILTPQSMTEIDSIAEQVCRVSSKYDKPLYTSFMGEADVASGIDMLQRQKIPHYILPESMCKAFACAYRFKNQHTKQWKEPEPLTVDNKTVKGILDTYGDQSSALIPEHLAYKIMQAYGLPVVEHRLVQSANEASQAATEIGFPVVLKVVSPDILHKFDLGGVKLNLNTAREVEAAYTKMIESVHEQQPAARIDGVLVNHQIHSAEELILGIKQDPSFGPVLLFGLGGLFVEIYRDVSFRVAPIDADVALGMIHDLKASPILTGARGRKPYDIKCIQDALCHLSQLAVDFPKIRELDINPLFVFEDGKGCMAADVKILL